MMAVRGLVSAVEQAGVERARFLAEIGLTVPQLEDVHARLGLEEYQRIVGAAVARADDPALGLHMAERASMGIYDALGYLSEHSSCLREALSIGMRYARVVTDGPQMTLQEDGDTLRLRLELGREDSPVVRMTAEFSTVSLLRLARRFVGEDAQAKRVCFRYPAPAHRAEYTRIFAGRELFSQAFTGMELPRAWLDQMQLCRSSELSALLETRAELLLARVEQTTPAADRVRRWLTANAEQHRPTMDTVARDLGMSARSLRRHLDQERTPFGVLLEEAQAERAKRMLADPRYTVQQAAYAMGFGTPSAFSRAFKRWTGKAPSAFRSPR